MAERTQAASRKTLVLQTGGEGRLPISGVEVMEWAEAQQDGHERFIKYDRFVCFPPLYPKHGDTDPEPRRLQMFLTLERRIGKGGIAIFLIPPREADRDGALSAASALVQEVTGAQVDPYTKPADLRVACTDDCPPRLEAHLDAHRPDAIVQVPADGLGLGPAVRNTVLAGFERPTEAPCAVAGYPGEGAWMVLPWRGSTEKQADVADVLALLDDLVVLRANEEARCAALFKEAVKAGGKPLHGRPGPQTAIGLVLAQLENAPPGAFVPLSRTEAKNVPRLRRRYEYRIESAKEARLRGVVVPGDACGYRLRPPE